MALRARDVLGLGEAVRHGVNLWNDWDIANIFTCLDGSSTRRTRGCSRTPVDWLSYERPAPLGLGKTVSGARSPNRATHWPTIGLPYHEPLYFTDREGHVFSNRSAELESVKYPQRPRAHELEDASLRHFERCLPEAWTAERVRSDYGFDIRVDIFDRS